MNSANTQEANPMQAIGKILPFRIGTGASLTPEQLEQETGRLARLDQARLIREQSATRQRLLAERVHGAGVGERHMPASFDTFTPKTSEQREALTQCRYFAENFSDARAAGINLILLGRPGSGKTHLAAAIIREVLQHDPASRRLVLFTTEQGLFSHLHSAYDRNATITEQQALDDLTRPDLLIIDEAGRYTAGDARKRISTLHAVLDARYRDCRCTVLTSNLSESALKAHYGQAAWSRLTGEGSPVVHVVGPDHRNLAARG